MLKQTILLAAVRLARTQGLLKLKRRDVLPRPPSCGNGTVNYHFESMEALRGAIIAHAVENEVIEVLVQARAERDPRLGRMSPALKERVANHIAGR
jgi:DNA-binding transcriptional regulator YbjK